MGVGESQEIFEVQNKCLFEGGIRVPAAIMLAWGKFLQA